MFLDIHQAPEIYQKYLNLIHIYVRSCPLEYIKRFYTKIHLLNLRHLNFDKGLLLLCKKRSFLCKKKVPRCVMQFFILSYVFLQFYCFWLRIVALHNKDLAHFILALLEDKTDVNTHFQNRTNLSVIKMGVHSIGYLCNSL